MSLNKQMIIGRLGGDPELRFTPSGRAVANFSVATDNVWKDAQGEKQKATTWHRIIVWGPAAENAVKYLKKGKQVYIEGRTEHRSYEDKDGNKRYITEVVVQGFGGIQFLDSGGKGGVPGPSDDDFHGRDDIGQQHPDDAGDADVDPGDVPF